MSQNTIQSPYSLGYSASTSLCFKNMRYSQSHEDFTHIEYEYPLRKRLWSNDFISLDCSVDRSSSSFLDSQFNYGCNESTPTHSSSQKPSKKEKKKATREDFVAKFKTEICKYWEEKGSCPYGKRCAFAHGTQDKRYKGPHHPHHQKESRIPSKCLNFHQHGYCAYGRRCQYLHFSGATRTKNNSCCYQEKLNNPDFFENHDTKCICFSRPRLTAFKLITSSALSSTDS